MDNGCDFFWECLYREFCLLECLFICNVLVVCVFLKCLGDGYIRLIEFV